MITVPVMPPQRIEKKIHMSVSIPESTYRRLMQICKATNRTQSDVVAYLVGAAQAQPAGDGRVD